MTHIIKTSWAAIAVSLFIHSTASAALSFGSGYSGSAYHTHSNTDSLYSFDWGSDGKLYYATGTPFYTFGGFYQTDGGVTTTIEAANSGFSGASVIASGSSIYYNDGSRNSIYRYDTISSSTSTINTPNYALGTDGSNLFVTGSTVFGTTNISYLPNGVGPATNLGSVAGYSGPLAFDNSGNLFYAPGFDDLSIYSWSSAEVAAAISGNGSLEAAGHLWLDYSASFSSVSGATSLLLDANGNVIVTLTSFSDLSSVVSFDASGSGAYNTILSSDERLGELRMHEGNLYLASENRILQIVPEPSTGLLSMLAVSSLLVRRRRS